MDVKNELDGQDLASSPKESVGGIVISDRHAAGSIALGDAANGNAPDLAVTRALVQAFPRWGRAPLTYCVVISSTCPGVFGTGYGHLFTFSPLDQRALLKEAYALTWMLDCFTKPTISLIDGAVNGAAAGLSLYGTHRVGAAGYRFSIPGPVIGWFPDHGTAHVLARLPAGIGAYLALTGRGLSRNDAHRLGLLTQCISAERFPHIAERLSDADPVDPLLDDLHRIEGGYELDARIESIVRCFAADSVQGIVSRLEAETGRNAAWAAEVAADIGKATPLALRLTLEHVRRARALDLRETLMQDWRIAVRLLADRAAGAGMLSASLSDIDDAALSAYFAPLEEGELELLTRAEMQAIGP